MAVFRPPLEACDAGVTPLNDGEGRVAEQLRALDDEWTIYVQPRIAQDIPDFVAVHDRHEVVRLLSTYPDLSPTDVAFLCDSHDAGLDAVSVIEGAGYPIHHIFARDEQSRNRRKRRFWPDAPGVKGCTVHSFKGWETPALVMGIGSDSKSKRLAYVALTRIRVGGPGRPAYVSAINSDLRIAGFDSVFRQWEIPAIPVWAPPLPDDRLG